MLAIVMARSRDRTLRENMAKAGEDRLIRPSGRLRRPGPLVGGRGRGKCPHEVRRERAGGNFATLGLVRELPREFAADRRQGRAGDMGV